MKETASDKKYEPFFIFENSKFLWTYCMAYYCLSCTTTVMLNPPSWILKIRAKRNKKYNYFQRKIPKTVFLGFGGCFKVTMLNFDYASKHILKVQLFCAILSHFVPFIKYVNIFGTKVGFEKKNCHFLRDFFQKYRHYW